MSCCSKKKLTRSCKRKDGKVFKLPRRFSKKRCLTGPVRGFTMRSSCAPYKYCKKHTKKQFLFNPNNPKKSFDVYINKNPSDTIPIKYTTVHDVQKTIKKLESLYKTGKYPHKRIWQVGMIMKVRLEAMLKHQKTKYPKAKNVKERFQLANQYFLFLRERTNIRDNKDRKILTFKI